MEFLARPCIYPDRLFRQETDLTQSFGIVDLFAGPGGLGEGFASLEAGGRRPFSIGISIEKEASAHQTLTLRAFLRACRNRTGALPETFLDLHSGRVPAADWSRVDPEAWEHAQAEARCLALGTQPASDAIDAAIDRMRREVDDTVLIGGPPCQAYSLVGRARAKGKKGYVPELDERHYLFREYIGVLNRLRPAAFVMENVKGMLSSTVESRHVFEMIMEDLSSLGTDQGHLYEIFAIRIENGIACLKPATRPADFIVRAEEFGVPQRRHRVILIGLRADVAANAGSARLPVSGRMRSVEDVIGALPALRSGLSKEADDPRSWRKIVIKAARAMATLHRTPETLDLLDAFETVADRLKREAPISRASKTLPETYGSQDDPVLKWLERPQLRALAQHETRGHMTSDLGRYLFAATFGATRGISPKAGDFPNALSPDHRNWGSGVFDDRFRVQLATAPSTTVTSHISKDGHYFIHPDPLQCRSLTVREAARLQTFPDDYLFLGNRTQQYVQVGNAVPPWLARQIASLVFMTLTKADTPSTQGASAAL